MLIDKRHNIIEDTPIAGMSHVVFWSIRSITSACDSSERDKSTTELDIVVTKRLFMFYIGFSVGLIFEDIHSFTMSSMVYKVQ